MQHSISRRIAYSWIGYISRGLLALAVAAVLAATPSGPPSSNGDQSTHNGDHEHEHERAPQVNWNK